MSRLLPSQPFSKALLCVLLGLPVTAYSAELRVKPALCAIGEDESMCSITVKITFDADDTARYCLTAANRGLIECFPGKPRSELQVYVATDVDLEFRVSDAESGAQVASTKLKVAKYRPKRHQRRYGWGLL